MNESLKRTLTSRSRAGATDPLRSLLVPVDLSAIADRVVGRVCRLPLADDARITLLHVVPGSLPHPEQGRAQRDARQALAEEAKQLARSLPASVRVESVVAVGNAADEIAAHASSTRAELVLMGRGGGRAIRDVFLGSTAERVIRRGQLPILVVRQAPRHAYLRPAVALDTDSSSAPVLSLLLRVIPAPRPRIAVIHAYDVPYRGMIYPSLSDEDAEERRVALESTAAQKLDRALATALASAGARAEDGPAWKLVIRYGSPRLVISAAAKKAQADLLVLGTHGYTGIAHVLLGTVAGDVLREVPCDVLVVPPVPSRGTKKA